MRDKSSETAELRSQSFFGSMIVACSCARAEHGSCRKIEVFSACAFSFSLKWDGLEAPEEEVPGHMGWRLQKRKCLDIKAQTRSRKAFTPSGKFWLGFELLAPGLGWPGPGPDLLQRASSSPEHGSRPQDIGF